MNPALLPTHLPTGRPVESWLDGLIITGCFVALVILALTAG